MELSVVHFCARTSINPQGSTMDEPNKRLSAYTPEVYGIRDSPDYGASSRFLTMTFTLS